MLFVSGYTQVNSSSYIKALRTCTDPNQFLKIIRTIGTPDSVIKEYSVASMENNSIYNSQFLKRAETFRVNLDSDPADEFVTQLIFVAENNPCHARWDPQQSLIYHLYIHDDSTALNKLLSFSHFHEISLEDSKPVTFGFEPTKRGYSQIIFTIDRIESCGVWEYASYKQKDTLLFLNNRFEYLTGKPFDKTETNFRSIIEDESD